MGSNFWVSLLLDVVTHPAFIFCAGLLIGKGLHWL